MFCPRDASQVRGEADEEEKGGSFRGLRTGEGVRGDGVAEEGGKRGKMGG